MTQEAINHDEEVIEMVSTQPTYEELLARVTELEEQLAAKPEVKAGRKAEVLAVLLENGHVSVAKIAKLVGISERNVSSQMSYLRKDGYAIATDSRGLKFIESKPE